MLCLLFRHNFKKSLCKNIFLVILNLRPITLAHVPPQMKPYPSPKNLRLCPFLSASPSPAAPFAWQTVFKALNTISFFLFFWSGHRGSKAYSLWDSVVPKPEHRLWLPLDSVPNFKILCFPSEIILLRFPTLRNSSGCLALQYILPVSSVLSSFLPPLCP